MRPRKRPPAPRRLAAARRAPAGTPIAVAHDVGTAERLLQAATELFAARGFEATAIRDVVREAGANLNSVVYYFGGKQGLYAAVLRRARERAAATAPARPGGNAAGVDPGPAAQRLQRLLRRLLGLFLDPGSRLPRLAALEIVNPSPAFDELVPALHAAEQAELQALVGELLGPRADAALVGQVARSVLAQCTHYMFMRPVLARIEPGFQPTAGALDGIAASIARFSLAALRELRRELESTPPAGLRPAIHAPPEEP